MKHAAALVLALAMKLLAVVRDAVDLALGFVRQLLESVGITGAAETVVLVVVGLGLVVAAFQLFGRLFLVLLAVFVLLMLLQASLPSLASHSGGG